MTQTTEGTGTGSVERVKFKILNGDVKNSNLRMTKTLSNFAQTLIVDPNGDDVNGNGGVLNPFKTIQRAHDYALQNISSSDQVIVKINSGNYLENLNITRSNIHFVGLVGGVSKATRLSGNVIIQISNSVTSPASDMISFENILIASATGNSVINAGGVVGYSLSLKDTYLFTSSSTASCLNVSNTANTGIKLELKNVILQNQSSSGVSLNLSNTYYANVEQLLVYGGTGGAINITTTDAVVYNSRFETMGGSFVIKTNSSFTPGKASLVLGNATLANPNLNASGIEIASGSIVNAAQVAFNVGSATGSGFAVKGVSGSVFINGNNIVVAGTNSKISSAITRVALTTSLTPA